MARKPFKRKYTKSGKKARKPGPAKKVGRKPKLIKPGMIILIRKYARQQMTKEQIAGALGMNYSTYAERQAENPEIAEAFEQGRAKGVADVSGKAVAMAMKGNKDLVKFYLERKGGWTQTSKQVMANDPENPMPVQTVLILPANGREFKQDGQSGAEAEPRAADAVPVKRGGHRPIRRRSRKR